VTTREVESPGARTGRGHALRSFLDSLRGTPAVPSSVGGELAAELAPLFALLDELEAEAAEARAAAALRLEAEQARTAEEVETILSFAHGQADAERDEVIEAAHRAADVDVRRIREAGAQEARRIEALAEEQRDALVEEVVSRILQPPGGAR
jgi:hypothetical protein